MKEQTEKQNPNRVDIIQTVKTPLGFFTLAVLVVEVILGISANLSEGSDRSNLIFGMLILIFLLIVIVAGLAVFRPEALSGKRPQDNLISYKNLSPNERIAKYRELIESETRNNLLENFYVPSGYKSEISIVDKYTFGFCYPQDWSFIRLPEQVRYGAAVDHNSKSEIGFARNMNLFITDISTFQSDLNELYDSGVQEVLTFLPKAKLIFQDKDYIYQGLIARRVRIDWTPQDDEKQTLSLYQIQVADKNRDNLYVLSFTTLKNDFEKARSVFDNIANTVRI